MQLVEPKPVNQIWAKRKTIAKVFDYKNPSDLLKQFRKYADDHPRVFGKHKAYLKNQGMDTLYNVLAFAFYLENKDLLEAGTRSLRFNDELDRLKEVYM